MRDILQPGSRVRLRPYTSYSTPGVVGTVVGRSAPFNMLWFPVYIVLFDGETKSAPVDVMYLAELPPLEQLAETV